MSRLKCILSPLFGILFIPFEFMFSLTIAINKANHCMLNHNRMLMLMFTILEYY